MIHADSRGTNPARQKMMYVGISRAKVSAAVYTDDRAKLVSAIMERWGETGRFGQSNERHRRGGDAFSIKERRCWVGTRIGSNVPHFRRLMAKAPCLKRAVPSTW
jgi:hypothetical protein